MSYFWHKDPLVLREINNLEDRIEQTRKQIEQLEYDITLYKRIIVSDIHTLEYDIPPKSLHNIWSHFNDKEKSEEYESDYKIIANIIKEIIADTKCNYSKRKIISRIVACGYGADAYHIHFICNEIEFILEVPNLECINTANLFSGNKGKTVLFYKDKNSYTHIIESYNMDDIKEAFKEFINTKTEYKTPKEKRKEYQHKYYEEVLKGKRAEKKQNEGDN